MIKENINEKFNEVILHCSATVEGQDFDIEDIRKWHIDRGFKDIGYHYVIKLDGTIQKGRSLNEIGAHCKDSSKNHTSIGLCYIGGLRSEEGEEYSADTRTEEQKKSLDFLLNQLKKVYPQLKFLSGHNDYANKDCPCFKVNEEYKNLVELYRK